MKQLLQADLQNEQLRDREIRSAFLGLTAALPSRPCSTFDNAARDASPVTPWATLQKAARAASAAAARDGRPIVAATTRERINALYDLLRADALASLPAEAIDCVVAVVHDETVAQSPADVAAIELVAKPTCRTRLLNYASKARHHARKLVTAADCTERAALNPQTTGVRLWS